MKVIDFISKEKGGEGPYKRDALKEVQILKLLQGHPHIIRYYTSFIENQCLHIIMEYAEKGDLTRFIRKAKETATPIDEDLIWLMAFQICLGVGYLHSMKTVHRDLKCMNIFLTKDNVVKIGDFGVARTYSDNSTLLTK